MKMNYDYEQVFFQFSLASYYRHKYSNNDDDDDDF